MFTKTHRLAELHTMLTSTVMIRRMKADILKNLPVKVREKAYIKIEDEHLRNEFRLYMQMLRQGKGVLGKLARRQHDNSPAADGLYQQPQYEGEDRARRNKEVLHHLYKITGQSKVGRVAATLRSWLDDPSKGKL